MTLKESIIDLVKLCFPIIIGQLGQMLIVAGDVYMASLYSTKSVAAIGVASGFINPILYFGIGLTMGISALLAIKRGEGKKQVDGLGSIITYGVLVGVALLVIMLLINTTVPLFGVKESLVQSIQDYTFIIAWSLPFAIIFQAIKEYLQGFELVVFSNAVAIISVLLNLVLNYVFIFGLGSFKGFGEIGLAYASLGIRITMAAIIFIYVFIKFKLGKPTLSLIYENLRFSLPIAFMFFLEVLAFCAVSILSGKITVIAAATNNLIMTIASVTFMIPLSLASATSVKVGNAYGQKNKKLIHKYIQASLCCVLVFIFCSSTGFFFFPEFIMNILTNDPDVIVLGIEILFIVAIFQLSDGFQVLLSGILRGLDETKLSSLTVFIGYWLIGIPIGIYLSFELKIGVQGLWIGLALSLTLVAFALSFFTLHRLKQ